MKSLLKEYFMRLDQIPEGPAMRAVRLEFEAEARVEGRVEGLRDGLLVLLQSRGLKLSQAELERIQSATDQDTLKGWLVKAVSAASVAEVLQ